MTCSTPRPEANSHTLAEAYARGRADALRDLRTVSQVAAELGLTRAMVARLARRLGVGHQVGQGVLLTPEDVAALRQRPKPGRPKREASDDA